MKKWLFFIPLSLFSLEVQPWFGDVYEFHLLSSYAYSFFRHVQGGVPQLNYLFHSNVWYEGLDFSFSPQWSADWDFQLAATSQQSFNVRSTALQLRYLWLDDIVGDPISLATGVSARYTPTHALHDLSCPSHATLDIELNIAFGREWEAKENWFFRAWGYGSVGHGNRGSPWVRGIAAIETNISDQHKLALYADGTCGYGRHTHLSTDHFDGYATIRNRSIDVGFRYGYRVGVWGTVRAEYVRRVLARASPASVNTWIVSYLLPFSF